MQPPHPRFASLAFLLLVLAGCGSQTRYGSAGEGRFVPLSDGELQRILGKYPSPGANASNEIRDAEGHALPYPAELTIFADQVIAYDVGAPQPIPEGENPVAALGPPDYKADIRHPPHAVSLGNGGAITLRFSDRALVDVDGPDLFIFEIGPSVEAMRVDISADGQRWIPVGEAPGGACCIDISPHVAPGEAFQYVRIRDIPHQGGESDAWPGADIDAVGVMPATRAVERVELPSEVLFAFDSSMLVDSAARELDQVVSAIQRRAGATVTILGHTDDLGTAEYNQRLSDQRARAVAAYLEDKGIRAERITARGYGESRPVAPGESDAERRKNRRVEILIQLQGR
jgi:OmpA-OmpF porin, OOP family